MICSEHRYLQIFHHQNGSPHFMGFFQGVKQGLEDLTLDLSNNRCRWLIDIFHITQEKRQKRFIGWLFEYDLPNSSNSILLGIAISNKNDGLMLVWPRLRTKTSSQMGIYPRKSKNLFPRPPQLLRTFRRRLRGRVRPKRHQIGQIGRARWVQHPESA